MSVTSDLVTLRGGSAARVYAIGAVPAGPTYPYVVVGYAPNAPQVRSLDGSGNPVRRFTVQHFGRSATSVETESAESFAAFDGKQILGETCEQEMATPIYRDPDDSGVLSTTHTYRF